MRPVRRRGAVIVIAFILGVFIVQTPLPSLPLLIALAVLALIFAGSRGFSPFFAALLVAALFCGAIYGDAAVRQATALTSWHGSDVQISGKVVRVPTGRNWVDVDVMSLNQERLANPVKVRLWRKWGDDAPLVRGMVIQADVHLSAPIGARNPGGYDEAKILRGTGMMTTGKALSSFERSALSSRDDFFSHLQKALFARLDAGLDSDGAALVKAILLGETGQLADTFYHRVQLLGLVHLFAVSGLHVGFLLGFVLAVARLFRQGRKAWLFFILVPLLFLYVALVGFPPAAVRAAMMAILALLAFFLYRYLDPVSILAYAALALLFVNPWCLWQLGFQLSFAVTTALIYLRPRIAALLAPLPKGLVEPLSVALAAEFASAPFIAYHYHLLTPLGVVANLFLVPVVGLLVPLVFMALLISFFWTPASLPFFWLAERLIDLILFVIRVPGKWLAAGHLHIGMPPFWALALISIVFLAFMIEWPQRLLLRRHHSPRSALLLLPLCLVLLYHPAPRDLALSVIDVGQGSAAAWQTKEGRWILFDCGYGVDTAASYLRSCGVNRLDAVILSHEDEDHIGGLARILEDFRVDQLYLSRRAAESEQMASLAALLEETATIVVADQQTVRIGSSEIALACLGQREEAQAPNAVGLAAYLCEGATRVLFPGDLDAATLDKLPWQDPPDILIVPHHGSKGSWNDAFLLPMAPKLAIASAGADNPFGHPDPLVVQGYERLGIPFMSTNKTGAILLNRSGDALTASTWLQMSRKTGQEFSDVI